jgi:preprotein translocase subunit SecG
MSILVYGLYVIFLAACLLLIVVILLQEGKGGGLSEAFGGMGGETFGHRAGGVNRVTSALAAVMIVSLVLIHTLRTETRSAGLLQVQEQPGINIPNGPGNQPPGPANPGPTNPGPAVPGTGSSTKPK